jgi:hypothetical protein
VDWKEDDFVGSNNGVLELQSEQPVVANQRSDEPVSRTRAKVWALSTGNGTDEFHKRGHDGGGTRNSRSTDGDFGKVAHVLVLYRVAEHETNECGEHRSACEGYVT